MVYQTAMESRDVRRTGLALLGVAALAFLAYYYWLGITSFPAHVHDDVIYLTVAKSLATGIGYRDLYLPGVPPHVSYPPIYPLSLVPVWWLWPTFPENLIAFKVLNIAWSLSAIGLMGLLAVRAYGMPLWQAALAMATFAFGGVVVAAIDMTMSEALFAMLLVAGMLGIERLADAPDRPRPYLPALIAGLAVVPMMTRMIGLCLPVAAVLWLFARGQRRLALQAGAVMAALYAPWALYVRFARAQAAGFDYVGWTVAHTGGLDPSLLAGFVVAHVPEVLTRTIPFAVAPGVGGVSPVLNLAISAVVLLGFVRLARPRIRLLHLVMAGYFAIILPFPWDTGRYVAAIAPLLIIAFVRGAAWPAEAALQTAVKPLIRATAVGLSVLLLLGGLAGIKRVGGIFIRNVHHDALLHEGDQRMLADYRAIAAWATRHMPADGLWLSTRPPLWYLWTGLPATEYVDGPEPSSTTRSLWRTHEAYAIHPVSGAYGWTFGALAVAYPEKVEVVYTTPAGLFQVYRLSRSW